MEEGERGERARENERRQREGESEREHDKRPEIRNDKRMREDWPGWRRRSILRGSENYS